MTKKCFIWHDFHRNKRKMFEVGDDEIVKYELWRCRNCGKIKREEASLSIQLAFLWGKVYQLEKINKIDKGEVIFKNNKWRENKKI